MKIYTDRFETTLPTKELQRVVAPWLFLCEQPVTRETLNLIRERQEEFRKVCEPPSPQKPVVAVGRFPQTLPVTDPAGKKTPWLLLGCSALVMVLGGIFLVTYEQSAHTSTQAVERPLVSSPGWPANEATPAPVATPQSEPTPFPHTELLDEVRKINPSITVTFAPTPAPRSEPELLRMMTPAPEVRRADVLVQMPYGETMWARVLGRLPDQEHLPLTGNRTGDAYLIGPYEFVWTEAGMWIDPVQ